jgi:hypothetical protein
MIIFVIPIICFIIALAVYIGDWGFDFEGLGLATLVGVAGFCAGLIILLFAVLGFEASDDAGKIIVETNRTELIALQDNYEIEGSACLFSSIIDEEMKYVYLYEDPARDITYKSIDADECYIKYINEGERPYIQEWEERCKSDFWYWLFALGRTHYTFYLPKGSVIENVYKVDLEG